MQGTFIYNIYTFYIYIIYTYIFCYVYSLPLSYFTQTAYPNYQTGCCTVLDDYWLSSQTVIRCAAYLPCAPATPLVKLEWPNIFGLLSENRSILFKAQGFTLQILWWNRPLWVWLRNIRLANEHRLSRDDRLSPAALYRTADNNSPFRPPITWNKCGGQGGRVTQLLRAGYGNLQ